MLGPAEAAKRAPSLQGRYAGVVEGGGGFVSVGACGGNVLWMEAGKRECNRIDSSSVAAETSLESQRRKCQTVDSPPIDRLESGGLQGI